MFNAAMLLVFRLKFWSGWYVFGIFFECIATMRVCLSRPKTQGIYKGLVSRLRMPRQFEPFTLYWKR